MKLVVLGTLAFDSIETPFGRVENVIGGSATYFSLAARNFSEVGVISVVGKDFDVKHLDFLKRKKIDVTGVEKTEGKTFRWQGYYEYDMAQAHTLKTELNVLQDFKPKIPKNYEKCKYLFLANTDPEIQLETLEKIKPEHSFCDTMNYWIEHKKKELTELLKKVDGVFMNEGEAREYCKTPNLIAAGRKLLNLGVEKVVIKKGESGAIFMSDKEFFSAPAYPLEVVKDPTGAGDSFAGGTIGHLAKHGSFTDDWIKKSMVCGSVISSYVVEDFGIESYRKLNHRDIQKRYNTFKKIVAFDHKI
ncbi:MAG: sugar kinase [Candidatus Altiarchaeales archaeon]|nr:sugar kinase [Candidatus Altiarchaeales archaeon]